MDRYNRSLNRRLTILLPLYWESTMNKAPIAAMILLLLTAVGAQAITSQSVKVEVVTDSESRSHITQGGGLIGLAVGHRAARPTTNHFRRHIYSCERSVAIPERDQMRVVPSARKPGQGMHGERTRLSRLLFSATERVAGNPDFRAVTAACGQRRYPRSRINVVAMDANCPQM